MEHEAGKRGEMQARQDGGQPLVVTGQAAEAGQPGEAALDDPASRHIGRFSSVMRSILSR